MKGKRERFFEVLRYALPPKLFARSPRLLKALTIGWVSRDALSVKPLQISCSAWRTLTSPPLYTTLTVTSAATARMTSTTNAIRTLLILNCI